MELCQNVDNAVVLARRGEIRSPENCLLCVFGQANPATPFNRINLWKEL